MTSSFYIRQKGTLLLDFRKKLDRVSGFVNSYFGGEEGDNLRNEFVESLAALIPVIPYIGGTKNPLTRELIQSAWALAIWDVLGHRGSTLDQAGIFVYRIREALIHSYPGFLLRLMGRYWFTWPSKNGRRKLAAFTQKREYESNFVMTFVEGEGERFDFGIDYTECAILKFFRRQGVEGLVPYLCASDVPMLKALNTGLRRTTTLALGGERCDFRMKRGGETCCSATSSIPGDSHQSPAPCRC